MRGIIFFLAVCLLSFTGFVSPVLGQVTTVSIPDTTVIPRPIWVPVRVTLGTAAADSTRTSVLIHIDYPAALEVATISNMNSITDGWSMTWEAKEKGNKGTLIVSTTKSPPEPLTTSGTLIHVSWDLKGTHVGDKYALNASVKLDEKKYETVGSISLYELWGDASGDSTVSSLDAGLLLQHLVGKTDFIDKYGLWWGELLNVSGEEGLTTYDVKLILELVAGSISQFPIETASHPPWKVVLVPERVVSLGTVEKQEDQFVVPVLIDEMAEVIGATVRLKAGEGIKLIGARQGELTSSYQFASKVADGTVTIALANHEGPAGSGEIAEIIFEANPDLREFPIFLEGAQLNEGNIPVRVLAERSLVFRPEQFVLYQNFPNPFNLSTTISYDLAEDTKVELVISNLLGQKVRALVDECQSTGGFYTVKWDGRDESGREVASGVYLYRLAAGEFRSVRRMLLTK